MIGSHIDSIHIRLKPHSIVSCPHQFERIGVGLYAGGGRSKSWDAQFSTWWDRDLGLGGKVLVKQGGRVVQRLFKSSHPGMTIHGVAIGKRIRLRDLVSCYYTLERERSR